MKDQELLTFNQIVRSGTFSVCKQFIESTPNFRYDIVLPIHMAVWYKTSILLTFLLERIKHHPQFQEELNRYDEDGLTPMYIASSQGDYVACKILIHYGADINKKDKYYGMTPFHIACYNNHIEIVDLFMQCDVDIYTRDTLNHSPLYDLNRQNNEQLLTYLIQYQKRREERQSLPNFITNQDLAKLVILGDYHICNQIIKETPSLLLEETAEGIPLHLACEYNHLSIFEMFLKSIHTSDLERKDRYGNTPLHYACKSGSKEICRQLVETYHVDIESINALKQTPVIVASVYGQKQIVQFLRRKKVNMECIDVHGHTVLDYIRLCNSAFSI